MEKELRPDYGNWVPKRLLLLLASISLLSVVLHIVSIYMEWGWVLTALFLVLIVVGLVSLVYMGILYRVFSLNGGAFMPKVHGYLVSRLPWDGKGTLLDVGCGSGALTIRCAKQFAESHCVGIDYWGLKWDYSQKMCQRNAEAEGVADRCSFQRGDANNLDFPDETFDAVVSNFVYHEVNDGKSKEELLRESLRVLKKGGVFALQDLFGQKAVYGDFQQTLNRLKADAVTEIHYADSCEEIPIPRWMQMPGMLPGVGLIYGRK